MSTHAHQNAVHGHDAHGHGGHDHADHVPHVLPLAVYFKTYGALLFLTVVTVGASYLKLGNVGGLIVAMAIATMKAAVVALIFMHLFWDQKFFAIIFTSSVLFLAIFLAFTMFDTTARGVADPIEGDRPIDYKVPFQAGGKQSDAFIKEAAEDEKKAFEASTAKDPSYVPQALTPAEVPAAAAPAGVAPAPPAGVAPAPGVAPPAGVAPAPGVAPPAPSPAQQ